MITSNQSRAARGFLDLSITEVAAAANISVNSLQLFESGKTKPTGDTLRKLVAAYATFGIEFNGTRGISMQDGHTEIFEGSERFDQFYDFLYNHLVEFGGDVCLSVTDDEMLRQYRSNIEIHRQRMKYLESSGAITFRMLAHKSKLFTGERTSNYGRSRWQQAPNHTPTAFYVFGCCLALITVQHRNPPYVVVLQSAPIAESYRYAFNKLWENAPNTPPHTD